LKPELRTVKTWKVVSSSALLISTTVSLLVGIFVYMTFWEATKSDIFEIYPSSRMIDAAKLLLCVTMVLTFPLPFFTCRELLVVTLIHPFCGSNIDLDNEMSGDLIEPLILSDEELVESTGVTSERTDISLSRRIYVSVPNNWLLPADDRQLQLLGHFILTALLWFVCTGLAIAAPSLGDVLDLVGCFSGTIIAFVLPAIVSFRLEGYSHLALLILVAGGSVGIVGTYFSVRKLFVDLQS
jgi:amino acid permease